TPSCLQPVLTSLMAKSAVGSPSIGIRTSGYSVRWPRPACWPRRIQPTVKRESLSCMPRVSGDVSGPRWRGKPS
ncbi:uncharacterized protein METZ01_LOCUS404346, partial [marine metagenome]